MSSSTAQEMAAGVLVGLIGAGGWFALAREGVRQRRLERWARRHSRQAEDAAVVASLEDEAFAPETIRAAVYEIVALAEMFWADAHRAVFVGRADGGVIYRWAHSHTDLSKSGPRLVERPVVDLLRVVNRSGDDEDRAVVRVRLRVHRVRGKAHGGSSVRSLDERWTFGRPRGHWDLLSVDGDPLAWAVLSSQQIPSAWADENRLREQSLTELANADMNGIRVVPAELATGDGNAYSQLLDLSNVDDRFTLALIGATLDHLVDVWEGATTGSRAPFSELCAPEALDQLLRPRVGSSRLRFVLQDATVLGWEPTECHRVADLFRVDVSVIVLGVRYLLSDVSWDHVAGSVEYRREISLHWTLELTESAAAPWRLVASTDPTAAIPGIYP